MSKISAWEEYNMMILGSKCHFIRCPKCGFDARKKYKFCPNCGCRMSNGEEDANDR